MRQWLFLTALVTEKANFPQTFELECHSSEASVISTSSASGGTSTNTSIPIQPRQRGQRGLCSEVLITSSIHRRQNTWAQCVITGVERESRHTGHSSSAPELNRVTSVDTSFWRSSSGVEQAGCKRTYCRVQGWNAKWLVAQNLFVRKKVYDISVGQWLFELRNCLLYPHYNLSLSIG